jgi:hypothetical protein
MLQGMFGKKMAEHFSLLESSSLVLDGLPTPQDQRRTND